MDIIIKDTNGNTLYEEQVVPGDSGRAILSAKVRVDAFDDLVVEVELDDEQEVGPWPA